MDDEGSVRHFVALLLRDRFPDRPVQAFATGRPAIAFCQQESVSLLITDLGLPDIHGLDIIRQLRAEGRIEHVIVMTGSPTDDLPRELWDLGVAGFLDKASLRDHLESAVVRVMAGGMYFSAQVTPARLREETAAAQTPTATATVGDADLSPRERDVARLVASGHLSKEIADQLHLSPRTVEKYRARVMHKVGVRSVPQLVYWCLRQGLV